jgi:hypothetical protein
VRPKVVRGNCVLTGESVLALLHCFLTPFFLPEVVNWPLVNTQYVAVRRAESAHRLRVPMDVETVESRWLP